MRKIEGREINALNCWINQHGFEQLSRAGQQQTAWWEKWKAGGLQAKPCLTAGGQREEQKWGRSLPPCAQHIFLMWQTANIISHRFSPASPSEFTMLRQCICMRPSPSFIPAVCSQRLWTVYGPVNSLSLQERKTQGNFLTILTYFFLTWRRWVNARCV